MPVTVTFSLKLTWIETVAPALYEPSAVEEVTPLTVGAVVSMTMFFALPRLPAAPGEASVSVALFVAVSLIVPPFSVRDWSRCSRGRRCLAGTHGVGERQGGGAAAGRVVDGGAARQRRAAACR